MKKNTIYLDNYRGFSNAIIPLEQVNFLVGENSTGKSSLLEALSVFFSPAFWFFEGEFTANNFGQKHFLDLVSINSKLRNYFSIGFFQENTENNEQTGSIFTYTNDEGRTRLSRHTRLKNGNISTIEKIRAKSNNINNNVALFRKSLDKLSHKEDMEADFKKETVRIDKLRIGLKRITLPENSSSLPLFFQHHMLANEKNEIETMPHEMPDLFNSGLVTLAPIRTKPLRTYDQPQTAFSPEGEHTPYIIKKQLSNKETAEKFKENLEKIGKDSGLFKELNIKKYGRGPQAPFELDVILDQHALSMDNVGYGVSQALPIFVEMLIRRNKTTFSIQQPEVHLHPKAQAAVGDFLAELAKSEQKSFFVETHSDFTIDRFRLNLRKSNAQKIKSQVLFFERHSKGNKVTAIEIQTNGQLSEHQPDAYREFFLNEQLDLLT